MILKVKHKANDGTIQSSNIRIITFIFNSLMKSCSYFSLKMKVKWNENHLMK